MPQLASLEWIWLLKGRAGVVIMELRSSQQRLTAASADRLCRREEKARSSHGDSGSIDDAAKLGMQGVTRLSIGKR